MPKLDPRIFRKLYIYPVLYNQSQIHLDHQNYLVHDNRRFIVKSLDETIYNQVEIVEDTSDCIPSLLVGRPAKCNFTENPNSKEIIQIDRQYILVNYKGEFSLTGSCIPSNRTLNGSYLIHFTNCSIEIDNHPYSSNISTLESEIIHIPLDGIPIESQHSILNLSLEHLHKTQMETRKILKHIQLQSHSLQWPHWTLAGGLPVTLIGLAFFIKYLFDRKTNVKFQIRNIQDETGTRSSEKREFRNQPLDSKNRNSWRNPTLTEIMEDIRTEPHI